MDTQVETLLKMGVTTWNKWRSQDTTLQVDLSDMVLQGINLNNMDLFLANVSRSDLRRTFLIQSDLRGATLVDSDLRHSIMIQADLRGADLTGANFQEANLSGADLRYANLTQANLKGANLGGADLRDSLLIDAQLIMSDLSGTNLTGACIQNWAINADTRLDELNCNYVFLNYQPDQQRKVNRFPADEHRILARGEFAQHFQLTFSSMVFSVPEGINWATFMRAYSRVQAEFNHDPIVIRSLEVSLQGDIMVKLDVPVTINRTDVEMALREYYFDSQDAQLSSSQQPYDQNRNVRQNRYTTLTEIIQRLAEDRSATRSNATSASQPQEH